MYNMKSADSNEFIDHDEIISSLKDSIAESKDILKIRDILNKAATFKGLTHREAAVLMNVDSPEIMGEIFDMAKKIKEHIYGRRIVLFAPLYMSDYCINNCSYCGYNTANPMKRRKLTQEELAEEVKILESMGHKRLALETGEDPKNCPLEYVLDCIKTIYSLKFDNGSIRRVNVNIAATTIDDYKRLKAAGIGTYILFQETYHKPTYLKIHRGGPKKNYEWHTEAHDRAMQAGIDDVGFGVLYGLYDWKYDTVAMLMHAEHMEAVHGVGPHTLSVPRILSASGVDSKDFPYLVNNNDFKKIVAILRLAVPYTGMILSTREPQGFREEVMAVGISQISAGSCTGVGGYADMNKLGTEEQQPQFVTQDHRSPMEIIKGLIKGGYIPSYCTACYREGRTGDRFMSLAKTGKIGNVCQPNAMLTLQEFIEDYGDDELKEIGTAIIDKEMATISDEKIKTKALSYLDKIRNGERDFRF